MNRSRAAQVRGSIHLASLDSLDRVLDQILPFGQTTTSRVQSSPVPQRELPLPGERR